VGYLNFNKLHLEHKDKTRNCDVKTSSDYLNDLNHSDLSDHEIEQFDNTDDMENNPEFTENNLIESSPVPPFECEQSQLTNVSNAAVNKEGWMWLAGVQGVGDNSRDAMQMAMQKLKGKHLSNK
jgi:hypothetical protein